MAVLLGAASARFYLSAWRDGTLDSLRELFLTYKAATLAVDFTDFGAVPRGLGGTLARLLAPGAVDAAIAFHLASGLAAAAVLAWLFATLRTSAIRRAAFAVVALALMLRWGEDGGRTDLAIVAALGAATLAWRSGRLAAAAAAIGLGLFVHEGSAVVGLPLLAALAWRDAARGEVDWPRLRAPLAVLGACYVALRWLPHATHAEIVARVRERVGDGEAVDVALYFALAGFRGVRAAMCQNALDPATTLHVATGLAALGLAAAALAPWRGASPWMVALACLPGYVLLVGVANDHARWTLWAILAVWLFAIALPTAALPDATRAPRWSDGACLGAACLLLLALVAPSRPGVSRVVAPVPRVDQWLFRSPGPPAGWTDVVGRCDPDWRDVLRSRP